MRILYWNIDKFGINKINNPSLKRQVGSNISHMAASADRLAYLGQFLTHNTPDIFVVVEINTGSYTEGQYVSAGGITGTMELLTHLRNQFPTNTPNPGWRLVPPLISGISGKAEGIAIYYDANKLQFIGPYRWPGSYGPAGSLTRIGQPTVYPPPWDTGNVDTSALPHRIVTSASPINAGLSESVLAGQFEFYPGGQTGQNNGSAPLNFPFNGARSPFLTQFLDLSNFDVLTLLAYHAPPAISQAAQGTAALANISEIGTIANNEVQVIVGDFNVSLFDNHYAPLAYNPLMNMGFNRAINPTVNQEPEKAYVTTHMKPRLEANAWSDNGYPGYGYMGGSILHPNSDAIDNIFTRYGAGMTPASPNNITIANGVVGSPYNACNPPNNPVPIGTYAYPVALQNPVPCAGYPSDDVGALSQFRGWNNFGKIRSTSDHMALVIDI